MPSFLDSAIRSLRLVRARARGSFVAERDLPTPLVVEGFDLGFPEGEAAYNGIGEVGDGTLAFAVGTKSLGSGARLFAFDPASSSLSVVADLDRVLAVPGVRAIPQGKVHTDLVPVGGALIGATHAGYYDRRGGVERPGTAAGRAPYPGGWFFAIERGRIVPLAQAPSGEGIITIGADALRGVLFALTWPRGLLLTFDLASGTLRDHGPVLGEGETGSKRDGTWVRICRSLAVVPGSGTVFWSDGAGRIVRFDGSSVETASSTPRSEMWRKVVWHAAKRVFYGVTWASGTLFRFDPASLACGEIGTLRAPGSPADAAATLALVLGHEGRTLHALATGPGVLRAGSVPLASTVSHLTFDLASGATRARGPLRLGDGRWVTQAQSLALAGGALYSVCWVEVPSDDRSPRAREIRELRRGSPELRARGYAEEIVLARFPAER